jgi:CheY-like chemotaxis protein/DNA-directed RNA polymerase specialized sigma24 family protein
MTVGDSLLVHVPYLRRFARALTGSQTAGDACVVAALEAILADKPPPQIPSRILLYRSLLEEIATRNLDGGSSALTPDKLEPVQRNLAVLTPMARQAFLLVAMEEFTIDEAAQVLRMLPDDVADLVDTASRGVSRQIATSVVIIEDEPLIALELEILVQDLGHQVLRIARTQREAVAAIRQTSPGLVLADIQLADGSSGLDAVNEILRDFSVPIIFITAYPERLLTGTKPEPTVLIRKPYRREAVKAVISQALFFDVRSSAPTA